MAVANDADEQITAMENIIHACSFGKLQARKLPAFDVEYLFLQIRARSIGENVDLVLSCDCGEKTKAVLDITKVNVVHVEGHRDTIDLGSGIILQLRYPRLQEIEEISDDPNIDNILRLIAKCIKSIWQGDEMFAAEDYNEAELLEFVENLSPANLDKLEEFFDSMPTLKHTMNWNCKACSKDNSIVLEGMKNFFA